MIKIYYKKIEMFEPVDMFEESPVVEGPFSFVPALATITDEDTINIPPVSLARKPDHCFFNIARFQEHNDHAPNFDGTAPGRAVKDGETYLERIKKDVVAALAATPEIVKREGVDMNALSVAESSLLQDGYMLLLHIDR